MTASEPTPDTARPPPDYQSFLDARASAERLHTPGGFSLGSLFLLVTAAGAIALLARNIVETKVEVGLITLHAVIGGFAGGIAGAIIGAGYPRLMAGLALGWFVGTVTGSVCAATAASGNSPWFFCVGAVSLLALGAASRWRHRE
ncbi:MAG TPA: hypothetical protein VHC22_09250 [Pirellulales bacterium]|nr:hypothetical protein [Pirellulales bacterium]